MNRFANSWMSLAVLLGTVGLLGLAINGCTGKPSPSTSHQAATHTGQTGDYIVQPPIRHANLTIFPVVSKSARDKDRYITLDEGLKTGLVKIFEMNGELAGQVNPAPNPGQAQLPAQPSVSEPAQNPGNDMPPNNSGGNDVNRLLVLNESDRPLYLMPGEIIVGGDQDRCIGRELVIKPSDKPTPIDVFCVEHGRWGQRRREETAAYLNAAIANPGNRRSIATADLDLSSTPGGERAGRQVAIDQAAEKANQGQFIASVGNLSKAGRLAVQQSKKQQLVWDTVAAENAKAGVENQSGAFTGNYVQTKAIERLEPYLESLEKPLIDRRQVVGVIVAIDGKVQSLDIFASTPLFHKLWPKLLKSYALDAANAFHNSTKQKGKPGGDECSIEKAESFLSQVLSGEKKRTETEKGVALTTRDTESVVAFSAHEADAASPSGAMGGGGFGGAVHVSGFAK